MAIEVEHKYLVLEGLQENFIVACSGFLLLWRRTEDEATFEMM